MSSTNSESNTCGRKSAAIKDMYVTKDNRYCCSIAGCNKSFAFSARRTALEEHYYSHPELDEEHRIFNNINEKSPLTWLTLAMVLFSVPSAFAECPEFQKFTSTTVGEHYTKYQIVKETFRLGDETTTRMLSNLSTDDRIITMGLDGWLDNTKAAITNIMLIDGNSSHFYKSIENLCQNTTTEYLFGIVSTAIEDLISKNIKIIAITTDNENKMVKLKDKIVDKYKMLIPIPCAAHVINLCFKRLKTLPVITAVINDTIVIINLCGDLDVKMHLHNLQLEDDATREPLVIQKFTEIRWLSVIQSLNRILQLQQYIDQLIEMNNEKYWEHLKDVCLLLKPFETAILSMQSDYITMRGVFNDFNKLLVSYTATAVPVQFSKDVATIQEIIKTKWYNFIDKRVEQTISLFHLDNIQITNTTKEFILEKAYYYLTFYKLVDQVNIPTLQAKLNIQLSKFVSKSGSFINIKSKYMNKVDEYKLLNETYTIHIFWNDHLHIATELITFILAFITIGPSEAAVERSFSIQGLIQTDERNRLSNLRINAEMSTRMNYRNLHN